jgi:drug/metabolite transporter (DMT)-like permease
MTAPASRPLLGIFWMFITGLNFVAVTALVKYVGDGVPAAQAAFLRYVIGLLFFLPFLPSLLKIRLSRPALGLFCLRGVAHTAAVVLWFFAMTRIPIAEVSALNYLSPIYVTLGAAFFLGERFALRRLLAVLAGLLGAVIILRPGMRELSSGHIAMLFTALGFAASYLIAKRMTTEASPTVVVVMLSVTVTIGLAPLAALDWVTPTGAQLFWLTLVAVFATAGHFTMTLAFQAAPVAVTQPMTFLQLVWAILLGAAFFGEPVDPYVVLGGTLIIAAVSFIAWREARVKETP